MKFDDQAQNLAVRISIVQIIVFILLAVLGVRLYYLQLVKGEQYATRAEEQRIRLLPIPAPRGAILDRHGKILVDSRPTYNIILSREALKNKQVDSLLEPFEQGLKIDGDAFREKLDYIKTRPETEQIVVKENASINDISWVDAHSLEYPEIRVELQPQRFYRYGTVLAHVLGYVGEISPKQLEQPEYIQRGLKSGDIIGKEGVESVYDEHLRGVDGYRKVVVDSRGRLQEEIEVVQPQSGQDLVTTIDLDLQLAAEQKLAESATKRGVIVSMDPRNGEVLVLASSPSFDPNAFVQRASTKEGRAEIRAFYNNPQKPLLNRAIRGRYYPGSTWKIPESVAALQQGAITVENSNVVCGGGITTGSKFTRCMGSHGSPPLEYAVTHSCDGYYYRLALKMKIEGLIKMVEMFEYDKRSGLDLPNELISRTPKYWKPYVEKRDGRWNDVETVFASIGQVTVEVTPISMLRAVSSIAVGGKLYTPHLLKEFKPVGAVGDPENVESYRPARSGFAYQAKEPKDVPMTTAQHQLMVKGMSGVVNNGGTGARIKIANFEIAGKTGTAQVAALGKDVGANKDHAWFVSFAPAQKPEIAVIALIENSGFGGTHAAPAVRGVYDAYLIKNYPQLVEQPATRSAAGSEN